MGPRGERIAEFPGAAYTTAIIGYAAKHGRLPSKVYREAQAHPHDYRLIFAYERVAAEEERKAMEKARKQPPTRRR